MTSYETINLLHRFNKIISNIPNLDSLFSTGEAQAAYMAKWVWEALNTADNSKAWAKIKGLNSQLVNGIPAEFKKTGSRKVYAEAEQMLSEIESLSSTYGVPLALYII